MQFWGTIGRQQLSLQGGPGGFLSPFAGVNLTFGVGVWLETHVAKPWCQGSGEKQAQQDACTCALLCISVIVFVYVMRGILVCLPTMYIHIITTHTHTVCGYHPCMCACVHMLNPSTRVCIYGIYVTPVYMFVFCP